MPIAGTQQLDSSWRPLSFQQKVNSKVNPMRFKYAYSYMRRQNANCENSFTSKNLHPLAFPCSC